MAIELSTANSYKILTATASLATSTYTLTAADAHAGGGVINDIPKVYDIDLTLGNMVINLFALSTVFAANSDGLGFTVKGTLTAEGAHTLVLKAFSAESEVNTICGLPTATVVGKGTGFMLTPAGSTNWLLLVCDSSS